MVGRVTPETEVGWDGTSPEFSGVGRVRDPVSSTSYLLTSSPLLNSQVTCGPVSPPTPVTGLGDVPRRFSGAPCPHRVRPCFGYLRTPLPLKLNHTSPKTRSTHVTIFPLSFLIRSPLVSYPFTDLRPYTLVPTPPPLFRPQQAQSSGPGTHGLVQVRYSSSLGTSQTLGVLLPTPSLTGPSTGLVTGVEFYGSDPGPSRVCSVV